MIEASRSDAAEPATFEAAGASRKRSVMRRLAIATSGALGVALLAACSGGSAGNSASTFIYAINANPANLNPAITTSTATTHTGCLMYEGLVTMDKDLQIQPQLAESWDVSADGTRYTFHMRPDVTWHDGEPFTSADVVWTVNNVTKPYGARAVSAFERITSVTAPDDKTVQIELSEPYSPMLANLTCLNAAVLPKHIFEGTDILENEANRNPIGTGPFKFEEWDSGSTITMVRNPDWWDPEGPYLDRVIMRIIPDADAATTALQAGEIDAIGSDSVTPSAVARVDEMTGVQAYHDDMFPSVDLLMFNTRREPLNDAAVRQGIVRAIDRNAIVENAFSGLGEPGQNAIGPAMQEYNNPDVNYMEMYPYDPVAAREVLAEAGAADPSGGLTLTLAYEQDKPGFDGAVQIIRQNLKDVGIEVVLKPMERTVMLEQVFRKHDFDLYYTSYAQGPHPEIGVTRAYKCDSIGTDSFNNVSAYCNEEVDRLFDRGARSLGDEANSAYAEAVGIIAEDMPALVVLQDRAMGLARTSVEGLALGAQPSTYWDRIRIED